MESPQKGSTMIQDGVDHDFVWEDYLEDTNSVAAPPTAFSHVEYSLESGFKVGMKLEIPSSDDFSSYWIATVIMTCGELLSLRYAGCADDRSADFWYNVKSGDIHPIGWCSANKKKLWPPKIVLEKCTDINALLSKELNNLDHSSTSLSEDIAASFMPIDQIKPGMKLEVLEEFNPQHLWIASIIQNVGGRLLLKYDSAKDIISEEFWLFYLSDRLQPLGYGEKCNLTYSPPQIMKEADIDWDAILKQSLMEGKNIPFPAHIFEPKIPIEVHGFKEGMKLEAVDPKHYVNICPATVYKVVNNHYFLVTIDDYQVENDKKSVLCCHSNSPFIFPIKWAEENNIELKIPKGYQDQSKFSWDSYLQYCNASPAPPELFSMCHMNMGFENGMKCEAADPFFPNIIKAATIEKIIEPLMWLRFDSEETENRIITSINSIDIYPVGWCASNCYSLQIPCSYKPKAKLNSTPVKIKENPIEKCDQIVPSQLPTEQHGKSWCPKIYFNHRCFSGPLLSKSRLAELPQAIGPGPVDLVIHDVISRVVNIAYKSSQVLQILQTTGKCSPSMQQRQIKAKYKGKSYRAIIEVVRNTEQVEDFCKKICTKLECCPYLFGPKHITDICPSKCHTQTKTKFGYNFVKKHKKVGRPPLNSNTSSSTSEDIIKKGPGRRKKRKHWTHLLKEFEENSQEKLSKSRDSSENEDTKKQDQEEIEEKSSQSTKEPLVPKKKLKLTPSSNIVTRGAKLPNFGLWHHVSSFHARRGRPRTRPIRPFPVITGRKVGRPVGSTKKAIADAQARNRKLLERERTSDNESDEKIDNCPSSSVPKLQSNPLKWSVEDVVKYLQKTECAPLAPLIKDQEIDGQALLMLNKCNVQEYLHLKPEPTEKFCYLIKKLKVEYFTSYRT